MTHWVCTMCGYYYQGSAPPQRCPSCETCCIFNNVTCYRPECGGEDNIDPLLWGVGGTPRVFKGACPPPQQDLNPLFPKVFTRDKIVIDPNYIGPERRSGGDRRMGKERRKSK